MREKRGKRGNKKSLDQAGDEETGKEGKGFFACYILTSLSPRHKGHTYIGFTVNPRRRIRQHNGEITSGAWRTKKKRPWEMVLCIYGFPTNVSALQFEWAWQHPRESLAVRDAAAAFKSFSGLASKIKLAYTMLNLPAWNSLNLTVNYFSSKYAHHSGLCPSLPTQMKVQVCAMDDLPCFTQLGSSSQLDESPEVDKEEKEEDEDTSSNGSQPRSSSTSSSSDLPPGEKEVQDRCFEKAKEAETVVEDRLANFRGFGLLDDSVEDEEVSHRNVASIETKEKEPETLSNGDRLLNFTGFGVFYESIEDEVPYSSTVGFIEAMEKDCWGRRSTSTTETEVVDLLTPSPSCRVGSSTKRRRVSEFIDLTKSPNFIEL